MFRFYPPENDAGGGYPHPRSCSCRECTKPQMIVDHTKEEPLMCAVCGCVWLEEQAPEERCPEATCPCHNKYWDQTDELIKRYLWGDR